MKSVKKRPSHYTLARDEATEQRMEEAKRMVLERTGIKVTASQVMRRGIELYLEELRTKEER